LYKPLTLQVWIIVSAGQVDQNGYQGAINQHHLPLFFKRANCHLNGPQCDFNSLRSRHKQAIDQAEQNGQGCSSRCGAGCLNHCVDERVARIVAA
jgi:hypothetical protein